MAAFFLLRDRFHPSPFGCAKRVDKNSFRVNGVKLTCPFLNTCATDAERSSRSWCGGRTIRRYALRAGIVMSLRSIRRLPRERMERRRKRRWDRAHRGCARILGFVDETEC